MFSLKKIVGGSNKYITNIYWNLGEKVLKLVSGLVVGIFVARHLGPENFGKLSYAFAMSGLFATATHMGLSGLVVRELVRKPNESSLILGTTFSLKLIMSTIAFFIFLSVAISTERVGSIEFWILVVVSSTLLFKPFEVFDFWFQSKVQARYTSIPKGIALVISSLLKLFFITIGAQVISFAFTFVIEAVIIAILISFFYSKKSGNTLLNLKVELLKAKELLSQGWIIFLGALFATVYLSIDQIMLKWLVGSEEVGIYAVAARMSEVWYFIPTVIATSFFPKLLTLREENYSSYNKNLQKLFDYLFIIAFSIAIIVTVFSKPTISLLYGSSYVKAGEILAIHIWAGLFIFMRAALSKWILAENVLMFSLISQGLGALSNIFFNLILIPQHKSHGAAIATLISYAIASYVSLVFYKKCHPVFHMMSKSLIAPLRLGNSWVYTIYAKCKINCRF